jgi:iron complex outermembrane receptor protein
MNPIVGVSVYAPELHKGTTTDVDGNYTISNLPVGSLKLVFEYVGYANQSKTILVTANKNSLNIVLEQAIFKMDEVIVSTAFNKLQSQNVMKVEHATIKELQQKGTATLIEGLATIQEFRKFQQEPP